MKTIIIPNPHAKLHPLGRWAVLLILSSLLLATSPRAEWPPELADFVHHAVADNAELAGKRAQLESARQGDKIARAALLPQISSRVNKMLTNENGNSEDGNREDLSIKFSLTQQLFNLPLRTSELAAIAQVKAAEARFQADLQNLKLSIVTAWLDWQFATDAFELTQARIKIADEQLKKAESFVIAGIGTKVDVLQARAQLESIRAELLQKKIDEQLAQDRLRYLSGLHGQQEGRFVLTGGSFPALASQNKWCRQVYNGSPLVAAARDDIKVAQLFARAGRETVYPRIVFSASTEIKGSLSDHKENVMLSLEQPLFTGGRLTAEREQLAQQIILADENLRAIIRAESLQCKQLHSQAAAAQSQWRALKVASQASEAALEAVKAGYDGGVRIAADVSDAEKDLFDLRLQLRRERYNYLQNLASLAAQAGKLDDNFINTLSALFALEGNTNV
ncbi:MAG: TolC family protein [Gammaproteobacteria bacterium]